MTESSLRGKTVLISGSTAGIGFAAAKAYAKEGAKVWLNGRSQERIDEAVKKLGTLVPGATLNGVVGDVSTADGVAQVTGALPKVDILVNNTGVYELKDFFDLTDDDWQRLFDTNVMSGIRLSRHYIKQMLEQNWGRIIFVSSESGVLIPTEMMHYGLSKISQIGIVKGLANLTKGTNVTVNTVLPGPTRTQGVDAHLCTKYGKNLTSEEIEKIGSEFVVERNPTSLIQRLLSEDEVASAILYLGRPEASGTNGASLPVEGGILRVLP